VAAVIDEGEPGFARPAAVASPESSIAGPALVTGATGFVGSRIARALLRQGVEVRVLARAGASRANLKGLDLEVCEGDLADPDSLRRAVRGIGALFHAAADYRIWVPDPHPMFRVNVDGSCALIRAAAEAGASRIVYTSSVATLGINKDGRPADEQTAVSFEDMIGPYKQSKFRAEDAVRALVRTTAAPVVIVNPSTPVGPGDVRPTPTGRLIVEAASGRMPAYVETGLNIVHVDDVAEGHLAAYRLGEIGERYILGGDDLSLGDILAVLARVVGRKPPTIRIPHAAVLPIAWMAETWARLTAGSEPFVTLDGVRMARKRMYFSSGKAERVLGYRHRPAEQALADAVAWFRATGFVP